VQEEKSQKKGATKKTIEEGQRRRVPEFHKTQIFKEHEKKRETGEQGRGDLRTGTLVQKKRFWQKKYNTLLAFITRKEHGQIMLHHVALFLL
jgi:hypothetical protein